MRKISKSCVWLWKICELSSLCILTGRRIKTKWEEFGRLSFWMQIFVALTGGSFVSLLVTPDQLHSCNKYLLFLGSMLWVPKCSVSCGPDCVRVCYLRDNPACTSTFLHLGWNMHHWILWGWDQKQHGAHSRLAWKLECGWSIVWTFLWGRLSS